MAEARCALSGGRGAGDFVVNLKLQTGGKDGAPAAPDVQTLPLRLQKMDRKLNILVAVVVSALLPFVFYLVLLVADRLRP